jgi:hypothetical protein
VARGGGRQGGGKRWWSWGEGAEGVREGSRGGRWRRRKGRRMLERRVKRHNGCETRSEGGGGEGLGAGE